MSSPDLFTHTVRKYLLNYRQSPGRYAHCHSIFQPCRVEFISSLDVDDYSMPCSDL